MEIIPYRMDLLFSYNNGGNFIIVKNNPGKLSCNICYIFSRVTFTQGKLFLNITIHAKDGPELNYIRTNVIYP